MTNFVSLQGSDKTLLKNSRPAGRVDLSETARLTVRVRSTSSLGALEALGYKLAAEPLAQRKYLSLSELELQFGAANADLDAVERLAQRHDLRVLKRSRVARTVVLEGQMGDLLSAFPADVRLYHHAGGSYRGRRGRIGVPQELAGVVTGVFGFDTRPHVRMRNRMTVTALSGPGGSNGQLATYFARRYQFPEVASGKPLDGSGQTIAIIELGGGYRNTDLSAFFHEANLPLPSVSAISVDHATNAPSTSDSADGEVMLDLEVAGAVVPKATFVVYFAPNRGDKGFLDAISDAIHDAEHRPGIISISWGSPEPPEQQAVQAYSELFRAAAALGITVCAASGDHGTAVQEADHWDGEIHVGHPASDPMVLGCGGTQVEQGADVVWNDNTPFDTGVEGGGGWASVGGISQIFKVPPYQQGIKMPPALVANPKPGRGVPDLAMSATDYFTRVDSSEGASGGTSAVAPLMAGLVARLNQARSVNVGFLNPFLYAHRAQGLFTDVTQGTNAIRNTTKGYPAGPDWNACTGLGTPIGMAILDHLP
jgi:kumamolisin